VPELNDGESVCRCLANLHVVLEFVPFRGALAQPLWLDQPSSSSRTLYGDRRSTRAEPGSPRPARRRTSLLPVQPLSRGAAVLPDRGEDFLGLHCRNSSYGLTICANRNAISMLVALSQSPVVILAVVSLHRLTTNGSRRRCRQVIRLIRNARCAVLSVCDVRAVIENLSCPSPSSSVWRGQLAHSGALNSASRLTGTCPCQTGSSLAISPLRIFCGMVNSAQLARWIELEFVAHVRTCHRSPMSRSHGGYRPPPGNWEGP